jgi:aspartyl-tRNA(Asn)/glutamyl-tRNA(Gln) amidotransferase subunit C
MSATLTRETVARVARLARLALSDDELELFTRQLAGILDYAEQIQAVDTAGIEPMSHAMQADAPGTDAAMWRDDTVAPSLDRGEVLGEAPDAARDAGVFRVPKVIG